MFFPEIRLKDSFELQITLQNVEPPIRRTLQIPARATLEVLHEAIQIAFQWKNSHPHEFRAGPLSRLGPSRAAPAPVSDESVTPLAAIANKGASFRYTYEFDPGWELQIKTTRHLKRTDSGLICISAERAAPPEDCGGPLAYQQKLAVLMDPSAPSYREVKRGLGAKFDPELFDLGPINRQLSALAKRKTRALDDPAAIQAASPIAVSDVEGLQILENLFSGKDSQRLMPLIAAVRQELTAEEARVQALAKASEPHLEGSFILKVTLRYTDPPIWRRLRVPADYTLGLLHRVLQYAFDWDGDHLHNFEIGKETFGPVLPDGTMDELMEESEVKLGALVKKGSKILYWYDFGDDWKHDIKVEKFDPGPCSEVQCLAGERAPALEDRGGPWGFSDILEVLNGPKNKYYRELKSTLPRGYDPAKFDLKLLNKALSELSARIGQQK